jgi:hypothetical protein
MFTEYIGKVIYETYILPALNLGDRTITIKATEACQRLTQNFAFDDVEIVCGVLGSMRFRNKYHLTLEAVEGQGGGIDTTFRFGLGFAKSGVSKSSETT